MKIKLHLMFSSCFQPSAEVIKSGEDLYVTSPLMDTERTLALLLGLHAAYLARSSPMSSEEADCAEWLRSDLFRGGLQLLTPRNPFEEEKGESRSSSVTTTPGTSPSHTFFSGLSFAFSCICYSANSKLAPVLWLND